MSFLESLAMYTASQKTVAYGFIACGVVLLASALLVLLLNSAASPLWQGFKIGALIFGLLILAGGVGYLKFSGDTETKVASQYQVNAEQTLAEESTRMNKVVSDFPTYQMVFAVIVLIALALIVFAKPFWSGVAFPVALLFILVLLIEAYSKTSIDEHTQFVNSAIEES